MKNGKLKRALSLLLSAVLLISLSGIGSAIQPDNTSGTVEYNGKEVTSEDNNVTVQKTATKVVGQDDTFEITLRVTTNDQVETVVSGTAAHVVLVIDTSGSMDNNRITNAKNAANTFVNKMLGSNVPEDNQVAVVTYDTDVRTEIGLSSSSSSVTSKINNIKTPSGGTNIQAGLQRAQQILTDGHKDGVKDVILLFSDGQPTYSYRLKGTATWTGCSTSWGGSHNWNDGWFGNGHVDANTVSVTGTTSTRIGNGSSFNVSNNLSLTSTCAHGKTRTDNYSYNGTDLENGNNGVAAIWQAGQAKNSGTEIYSVLLMGSNESGYSNANSVMGKIASTPNHFKSTTDMADLAKLFANISDQITTPTNAGRVIDPMGDFITFDLPSIADEISASFDSDTNTLTWDTSKVDPVVSGNSKIYTLTYRIKLNTSAEGFIENQAYSTNGTTTFYYEVEDTDGSVDFDVPKVSGKIPSVPYTINYYLQDTATLGDYDDYAKDDSATITNTAKLHSNVSLPVGYEGKYTSQYYELEKADTSIKLGTGNNILNVYYKHQKVNVTVEHYLKTTTIETDGTESTNEYQLITASTVNSTINKGSSYTATKLGSYTFDSSNPTDLTVNSVLSDTTFKLYYSTTVDKRKAASVEVYHKYNTYEWVLNGDGIYKKSLVEGTPTLLGSTQTGLKATDPYITSTADVPGHSYVPNSATITSGSKTSENPADHTASFRLGEGLNKIYLTFVKDVPAPSAAQATIEVTHKYTLNVTEIIDGKAVTTTTAHNDIVETLPTEGTYYYAGETRTVSANNVTPGDGYTYVVSGNSSRAVTLVAGVNKVTFNYHYESAPEKVDVTVNHVFRTFEDYTNDEGETDRREIEDERITDLPITEQKYINEIFTAGTNPNGHEGYVINEEESDNYENILVTESGLNLTIYYDKIEDNRDDASLTVTHTYFNVVKKVVDGKVVTVEEPAGKEDDDTITGKVGDDYTASEKLSHDSFSDWQRTDGLPLTGTLTEGENKTLELVYKRSVDAREQTTYTTNYYYYDWVMTIKDGIADYYDYESNRTDSTVHSHQLGTPVDSYVNVKVDLTDKTENGYKPNSNNPELVQYLEAGDNIFNFVYTKKIPLPQIQVNVRHNYTHTTISEVGVSTDANSFTTSTLPNQYVGATVNVPAIPDGYTLISVVVTSGETSVEFTKDDKTGDIHFIAPESDASVVFNYKKITDNSKKADYTIEHYFRTKDWDNSYSDYELDNSGTKNTGGSSFASVVIPFAIYEENGYSKDRIDSLGGTVTDNKLTLSEGNNTVKVYYTKEIDSRVATRVKIVHNYYTLDTYTNLRSTGPVKTVIEYIDSYNSYEELILWVGGSYTATPVYNYDLGGVTYTANKFDSENPNTPEDLTIHELRAYVGASPEAGEIVDTITINYLREFSSYTPPYIPPTELDRYTITVNYKDRTTGEDIASPDVTTLSEYSTYDVTAATNRTIDGYVFESVSGGPVSGTLRNNVSITVYYTAESVDIEDPDVPLTDPDKDVDVDTDTDQKPDLPEVEIDIEDTDVPLGDAPATGDSSSLMAWIAAAVSSSIGLLWLAIADLKRRKESHN